MINRVHIRIGNNSVPISRVFLDALSVTKYGTKYGPNTKKEIAELIRELMKGKERMNTNTVYEMIILEVLPKTKRGIILKEQE